MQGGIKRKFYLNSLNLDDKLSLISNLLVMLRSGLSITESLNVISEQSTSLLRHISLDIHQSVLAGNSLADSFLRHPKVFSKLFVSIIRAGEMSGSLEESLENLTLQLEKEKEIREKVKSAMTYPVLVLSISFILAISLSIFVLPKIVPIFSGLKVDLPASTKALISFSTYVQEHQILFLIQTFGTVFFLLWLKSFSFVKKYTHFFVLLLPITKTVSRYSNVSRFSRTMASLLKSGISIDESLLITAKTLNNIYYQKIVKEIALEISGGDKLSEAMSSYEKYFTKLSISMLRVAEKSGQLEEILLNLAKINENKLETSVKRLSELIEPLLLIVVGLVVAWIAISIISPIYEITGSVYN